MHRPLTRTLLFVFAIFLAVSAAADQPLLRPSAQ